MPESTNEPPRPPFADAETALGGADAVEKTTYVVGEGTDPNTTSPAGRPPRVGRGGGMSWIGWLVVAVAVIVAAVYIFGSAGSR